MCLIAPGRQALGHLVHRPARCFILLFALASGTARTGAPEDSMEEQRHLEDGSQVRPNVQARLLLQLDDLSGSLRDASLRGLAVVRRPHRAPSTVTNAIGLVVHRGRTRTPSV